MFVMYRRIVLQTAINNRDMGLINSDHFRSLLFKNCVHPTESPLFVVFSCKFVEENIVCHFGTREESELLIHVGDSQLISVVMKP